MIVQHLPALSQRRVVLASKSPRRHEILKFLGLTRFDTIASSFEENLDPKSFSNAADYAVETALRKAKDVSSTAAAAADLVIAADTIVEIDGDVLEKPANRDAAFQMLSRMSGRSHFVHTGVALVLPGVTDPAAGGSQLIRQFSSTTTVWFDELCEEAIYAYIDTGEPMDKAGAYGIQGRGGAFVKRIDGCYFNVMGLPMNALCRELLSLIKIKALKLDDGA